ncbi:MAG: hypothetical protein ABF868_00405 [Sporolactobacillus sp.]
MTAKDDGPLRLTPRRIGVQAALNPAPINHYFGSKDALMSEAARHFIRMAADQLTESEANGRSPSEGPIAIVQQLADLTMRHADLLQPAVEYELQKASLQLPEYLIPLLTAHFGGWKTAFDIRMGRLQYPFLNVFFKILNEHGYSGYAC